MGTLRTSLHIQPREQLDSLRLFPGRKKSTFFFIPTSPHFTPKSHASWLINLQYHVWSFSPHPWGARSSGFNNDDYMESAVLGHAAAQLTFNAVLVEANNVEGRADFHLGVSHYETVCCRLRNILVSPKRNERQCHHQRSVQRASEGCDQESKVFLSSLHNIIRQKPLSIF